jgi:hypothetical protein
MTGGATLDTVATVELAAEFPFLNKTFFKKKKL